MTSIVNKPVVRHIGWITASIVVAILIIDQIIKIYVKTHFYLGEDYRITEWFHLVFVENNGMAFGMELGGKLFLSLFRIVAVAALIWLLVRLCKEYGKGSGRVRIGVIVCLAMITAGAAGNIIDCIFYGELFTNPYPPAVATFAEDGDGYATWFYGKVVDMFYFPLFSFNWPKWIPIIGGSNFLFFQPVFNFADAAISVGVIVLLLFYSKFLTNFGGGTNADEENSSASI